MSDGYLGQCYMTVARRRGAGFLLVNLGPGAAVSGNLLDPALHLID